MFGHPSVAARSKFLEATTNDTLGPQSCREARGRDLGFDRCPGLWTAAFSCLDAALA